ncbi:hypothetical protein HZS_3886 [Henneguya salminicola]|nr:hypothetical protein HZS_3886 [Henneguya salminicola]
METQKKLKSTVGKSKSQKPKVDVGHPTYTEMIIEALKTLKERGGSSRQKISKYVLVHYPKCGEVRQINQRVVMAIRRMIKSNLIQNTKGLGASGSLKLVPSPDVKKSKPSKPKPSKSLVKSSKISKKTTVKKVSKPKTIPSKTSQPKTQSSRVKSAVSKLKTSSKPNLPKPLVSS